MKGKQSEVGDYIICLSVFWYGVVSMFLMILINLGVLSEETQTSYRVIMTAIPLSCAILIGVRRKTIMFLTVYFFAAVVLLLTIVIFPSNEPYIIKEGLRFLLPTCVSSALCMVAIRDLNVVVRSLKIVSYVITVLAFSFFLFYLRGFFSISEYSMSFSYSCLLPMMVFYNEKKPYSMIISVFLFLMVIAIGSRGAAFSFVIYILFDVFASSNKRKWWILLLSFLFIVLLPFFENYLGSIGISSRTLNMAEDNDLFSSTGRNTIQKGAWQLIADYPFGMGIYGDRANLGGAYCHNIFLELLVDFGWIIGGGICLISLYSIVNLFIRTKGKYKNYLLIMFVVGIVPLFASGSVFQQAEPWWLLGFSVLLNNNIKHNRQLIVKEIK